MFENYNSRRPGFAGYATFESYAELISESRMEG